MDKNKKIIIKSIYIALIILNICLILYVIKYYHDINNSRKESNLLDNISIAENIVSKERNNSNTEISDETEFGVETIQIKTDRMLKLEELQKENSDIIGWIEIENTNINYPVLQGSDNSFYMRHNYKKDYSINGSIFLDKDYSWNPPSSNLLIYGHNNKNNTMFQDLLKYSNVEFYNQHPIIRFTTNNEDVNYEIIAVFQSKVYYKSDVNVFRYYYFINSENEEQYNSYVKNAKNSSLYETGKTAIYGEQLMTLSTCSYHTTDGRFVVVAKKSS